MPKTADPLYPYPPDGRQVVKDLVATGPPEKTDTY